MAVFRQKNFGKGDLIGYLKKHPTLPIGTAALAVSTANLSTNTKRQREARDLSEKQLKLLEKQTEAISANTKAINDSIISSREVSNAFREGIPKRIEDTPKKRKKLFKKFFSVKSDIIAGAQIGGSLGGLSTLSNTFTKKLDTKVPKYKDLSGWEKKTGLVVAGTIVGGLLGALVGSIGELDKRISRRDINKRLLPEVISRLKKDNLKEGRDFTRDPKIADRLKTRVCIAVSRNSGDLRILINTNADPKLKNITDRIVKNIPNSNVDLKTASNKFNDITISTISDNSSDAGLISGIAYQFIHSGFPVYLVEVG